MAMYKHQYDEHYVTTGISVTASKDIAFNIYGQNNGVVVKLSCKKIEELNIKVLTLKDELAEHLIRHPEDEESILVCTEIHPSIVVDTICSNSNKSMNMDKFKHAFASLQNV